MGAGDQVPPVEYNGRNTLNPILYPKLLFLLHRTSIPPVLQDPERLGFIQANTAGNLYQNSIVVQIFPVPEVSFQKVPFSKDVLVPAGRPNE